MKLLENVLRNMSRKPVTRLYPVQVRAPMAGSRGQLDISVGDCVFCGACQRACPAAAIAVDRKARSWTLDPFRCIVCGYCVEVCPKKCLSFSPLHRPPTA